MSKNPIYAADMIARHTNGLYVVIERLSFPKGLAFPGGKQDPGETLSETAPREYAEETGLQFTAHGVLNTYAQLDRDPRDWFVTTVFYGTASGKPKDEAGMTMVRLLTKERIDAEKHHFVLGHRQMWEDYLSLVQKEL